MSDRDLTTRATSGSIYTNISDTISASFFPDDWKTFTGSSISVHTPQNIFININDILNSELLKDDVEVTTKYIYILNDNNHTLTCTKVSDLPVGAIICIENTHASDRFVRSDGVLVKMR